MQVVRRVKTKKKGKGIRIRNRLLTNTTGRAKIEGSDDPNDYMDFSDDDYHLGRLVGPYSFNGNRQK